MNAIEYKPNVVGSASAPRSMRSPFVARKPRIDPKNTHLPKRRISFAAARSKRNELDAPGRNVWLHHTRARLENMVPATRAQIVRFTSAQAIMRASDAA